MRRLQFLLLVALLLPLLSLRACDERTLWVDEIHTLQHSQLSVPRLLDESVRDVHPPGYALSVKAWIEAGRWLPFTDREPGTPWARGMNLVAWLLAVTWVWFVGGAALGRGGGALLALVAGGSAAAAMVAGDLRGYAVVQPALLVAVVALARLATLGVEAGRRQQFVLWAVYALALAVALWNHLLAAPPAALLAATWLALAWRHRSEAAAWRLAPGLAAHAVPWLLFLPWLLEVPRQMAHLDRVGADWMTPATFEHLLAVFARWLPLGRAALSPAVAPWLLALGAVAVLLPLAAWGHSRRRGEGHGDGRHDRRAAAATLAALALPPAVGGVLAYWGLARLGWAATFHAPRYPLLVAGLFAAGLAGAALAAAPRPRRAALLLAPWLLASLTGQLLAWQQAARPQGLAALRPQIERWAAEGGVATTSGAPVLHVTPPELAPFVRHTFSGFDLAAPREIACSPGGHPVSLLLDVNPWTALDRDADRLLDRVLVPGRLAAEVERIDFRDARATATAYRLRGVDRALAAELCHLGLRPRSPVPATAAAAALPGDQLAADGWLFVEVGGDLVARRWGARREVRLRFDRRLPAGDYRLHLTGVREPYPQPVETLTLALEGGPPLGVVSVPAGRFAVDLPLSLEQVQRPRLTVAHPLWSPAEASGSRDRRWLSFQLEAAWLVPVAGERQGRSR